MTRSVINDEQGVALLIRPLCFKQPGCKISGENMRPRREVNVIGSQESFGRGGEEDGNEEDAPFFLGENINSNFSKDIWNVDIK